MAKDYIEVYRSLLTAAKSDGGRDELDNQPLLIGDAAPRLQVA
jgi:hypothetical protein